MPEVMLTCWRRIFAKIERLSCVAREDDSRQSRAFDFSVIEDGTCNANVNTDMDYEHKFGRGETLLSSVLQSFSVEDNRYA